MRPLHIAEALKLAYRQNRSCFVQGDPGVGKSDVYKQVCRDLAIGLVDVRLPQFDRVDLTGVPYVDASNHTRWATPAFWPTTGSGIILFDEINAAPRELQPPTYQIFLDRVLGGEYALPPGWVPMAAGNLETNGAITQKMSTAWNSRVIHLRFESHIDDFLAWAPANDIVAPVIAFLRFRPDMLHVFDPRAEEKAFACPRTWSFVSDIAKANPSREIALEMYAGCVGRGAAGEFLGFIRLFEKLPRLETIIRNPATAALPVDDASTMFALTAGLARRSTAANFDAVMTYARRMPREWAAYLVADAVRRDRAEAQNAAAAGQPEPARIVNTRGYIDWVSSNGEV